MKPRNKPLNDILKTKKGGAHEAKQGDKAKRSRQKEQTEKEIKTELE